MRKKASERLIRRLNRLRHLAAIALAVALAVAMLFGDDTGKADSAPQGLRCEYLSNPLGIDVQKPRLSWVLDGMSGQSAYRVLVASSPSNLQRDQGDLWDSGRISSPQSTWVEYSGKKLVSGQQAYWKVRSWSETGKLSAWSAPASWSMGLLEASDWHAQWIGERRPDGTAEGTPLSSPWLRKTFTLARKPIRAVAYVNPLGYYELYINGRKVDDHVLSPAVSDYSKRNLYVTHEIVEYLVPGKNVVALWLGRGWYVKGHPGVIHDGPLVRAQVDISFPKGANTQIITDDTWKVRESPITPLGRGTAFGDYGGERHDTARELAGWNQTDLDDSGWQAAASFEPPKVVTAAQMVEPNRVMETIKAVRVDAWPHGGWVIDMGRNFTGWFEIKLPAMAKGSTVKLEYSDQKEPDKPAPGAKASRSGNQSAFPNTFNQRDEVIGNDDALTFRSRFNYHGFRYVRVMGTDTAPDVAGATGYLIRTAYERAGEFTSSSDLLNQIYQLVTRTYEALTLGGYVVDCPTRERLGYGGDAGTSMETGMFNFSVGSLYNRWLSNWRDAQDPESGSLPHTAPNYPNQGGGGPMWGGMVVTLPWQMYLQYGDKGVLDANYVMIRQWLDYLASETTGDLLLRHKSHAMSMQTWNFLGDWLTPKGSFRGDSPDPRPAQLINSVHYVYQLQTASKIANTLGKKSDSAAYSARADAVSKAIHQNFYNPADHSYGNGDSVQEAFPLLVGVVPPELRSGVTEKLDNVIRVQNGGHLDTGMHGTYFLIKYLMEADRNDLIHTMTNTKEYPGWGYMLANGATTSWEGWTGQSHIHDTLLSIGAWFTEGLAGIRSDGESPGFKHFVIKPAVVGDLTFAKAKYRSIHGDIVSDWRIEKGMFRLQVTIPPGTTATVFLPGKAGVETAPGTHLFEAAL